MPTLAPVASSPVDGAIVELNASSDGGKTEVSLWNRSMASRTSFKSECKEASLLRALELMNRGIAIAARTAMTMMTIRSSTSVKPLDRPIRLLRCMISP